MPTADMQPTIFKGAMNTVDSSLAGGTAIGNQVIRLFTDYQRYMNPDETPFTSSVGTGQTVNQKKLEWGSSFLAPHQVTLGAAVADAVTTSITLAAGEVAKVMVTDLIKIEAEIVWVTAINAATNVLTVVRGMGGSTAAAHTLNGADGQPRILELLSPAAQENADTPLAPIAKGSQEYNLPQLFDQGIQVSEREDNTPSLEFGGGSRYDAYLKQVMKNTSIEFEKTAIHGRRGSESSAVVGSGTPTTMGGLDFFTPKEINLAGAPISELIFGNMLQQSWERVGSENTPKTLLLGPFMRRAISSLWNSNRYSTMKEKDVNLVWNTVETDFGVIRFTLSRYIPAGSGFLVDLDDIKKHAYKGGEWKEVLLPSNGPYKRGRFTGDYTMSFRGEQKRIKFTNASVNPADYPNF